MCLSKWTTLLALIETLWEKPKTFIRRKKNCLRTLFNSYHYGRNSQVFLVSSSDSVLLYRFSISTYSGESGRTRRFFIRWWYLVPFSTYSTGVPRDPRQSKMWRQEIACHRLGSQWRHSTTHESVSIVKTKTDIIETQQRATWLQKPPKSQSLDARFCCSARVAYKWCHRMFGCVAITTPQTLGGTRIEWKSNTG